MYYIYVPNTGKNAENRKTVLCKLTCSAIPNIRYKYKARVTILSIE